MTDPTYTFSELAAESGVSPRQVRVYIDRDLLPRADRKGRGARYPRIALDRLRAITRLREGAPPSTTLEQVRELLDQLEEAGLLEEVGSGRIPFQIIDDGRDEARIDMSPSGQWLGVAGGMSAPGSPGSSDVPDHAADRRERREMNRPADRTSAPASPETVRRGPTLTARPGEAPTVRMDPRGRRTTAPRQLAELVRRLELAEEHRPITRPVRVPTRDRDQEPWHRVAAGRDLEIHARGPLSGEDIELLEDAALLVRRLLHARRPSRGEQEEEESPKRSSRPRHTRPSRSPRKAGAAEDTPDPPGQST